MGEKFRGGVGKLSEAQIEGKIQAAKELIVAKGFAIGDKVTVKDVNPRTGKWEKHDGWEVAIIPTGVDMNDEYADEDPHLLVVNPSNRTQFTNIKLSKLLKLNPKK